jgi:hypothetical protein
LAFPVEEERRPIAVADPLRVAVRFSDPVLLARPRPIDAAGVLGDVVVQDRVSNIVVATADQPAEHVLGVFRICDPRRRVETVDGKNVVLRQRAPMRLAVSIEVQRSMRANRPSMRGR